MLQSEMGTDIMPGAFDASSRANHSVEAAKVPTPPTQDVLPKALPVALSLIKLASTNTHAAQSLGGRPKPPYAGLDSPGEGYPVMKPPSATNSEPVLYELSSEARNAASFAISRGVPVRPIGA